MDATGDIEVKGFVTATEVVHLNAGRDINTQNGALLSVPGDTQAHKELKAYVDICLGGDLQLSAKGTILVSRNTWLDVSKCHGAGSVLLWAKSIHMSGTIKAVASPEPCGVDVLHASSTVQVTKETYSIA